MHSLLVKVDDDLLIPHSHFADNGKRETSRVSSVLVGVMTG